MTREIKFRAWDGRQMVHDGDHWNGDNRQNNVPSFAHPVSITNKGIHWCRKLGLLKPGDIVRDEADNEGYANWEIDRVTRDVEIMQYTGRSDKRHVEMCEHDLVEVLGQNYRYMVEAVWNEDTACFDIEPRTDQYPDYLDWVELVTDRSHQIRVIGNIYENPGLVG